MTVAIDCKGVDFAYREVKVLDNITLQIQEGKFTLVIGPNGGGKTTLLKLIMGLLKPSDGQVLIYDRPPYKAVPLIGYVPQSLKYDRQFPITVIEVVLMGRLFNIEKWYKAYSKKDYEKALEALSIVGMETYVNSVFGELSGGQAQRVLIARAFAAEPRILLLDEPTANVDAQSEAEIYRILFQWHKEKQITVLMASHHIQKLLTQVDQVLCVQRNISLLKPTEVCNHFAMGLYPIN
ncbi:MAG: ABC-type transporter, ATPase subunit [Chlamydiales bacterium]|jgi:zinc transport system ATP-binding protein|nr:ABC-type transporter, ATPase subunit [Chlamydiales bacterium]